MVEDLTAFIYFFHWLFCHHQKMHCIPMAYGSKWRRARDHTHVSSLKAPACKRSGYAGWSERGRRYPSPVVAGFFFFFFFLPFFLPPSSSSRRQPSDRGLVVFSRGPAVPPKTSQFPLVCRVVRTSEFGPPAQLRSISNFLVSNSSFRPVECRKVPIIQNGLNVETSVTPTSRPQSWNVFAQFPFLRSWNILFPSCVITEWKSWSNNRFITWKKKKESLFLIFGPWYSFYMSVFSFYLSGWKKVDRTTG